MLQTAGTICTQVWEFYRRQLNFSFAFLKTFIMECHVLKDWESTPTCEVYKTQEQEVQPSETKIFKIQIHRSTRRVFKFHFLTWTPQYRMVIMICLTWIWLILNYENKLNTLKVFCHLLIAFWATAVKSVNKRGCWAQVKLVTIQIKSFLRKK